jgi:hypothetical protein
VAQVVEHLPSELKAPSTNFSTVKRKKEKKMLGSSVLGRLRQKDHKFKASLGHRERERERERELVKMN